MNDILFKNRNKAYGAYDLRKKYNKTLFISLIISALLVSSSVLIPFLANVKEQYTENFIISKTIVAELMPLENIEMPEIKPQKPQVTPEQPKISEKPEDKTEAEVSPAENNKDSIENKPEEKQESLADEETIDGNGLFSFNNRQAFSQWVDQNYNRSLLENNKLKGTILLKFSVNERGFVDSAKIIAGIDPSLDNEATRVVLNSPRWKPFIYNGHKRRMEYLIPININLNKSN